MLQWFSGNIGFHHIHHLSPRIPDYRLQACREPHPMFRAVKHVTLRSSLKSLGYRLWDEERKQLVGFAFVPVYLAKVRATGQPQRPPPPCRCSWPWPSP